VEAFSLGTELRHITSPKTGLGCGFGERWNESVPLRYPSNFPECSPGRTGDSHRGLEGYVLMSSPDPRSTLA